jgi:hypothetical protein
MPTRAQVDRMGTTWTTPRGSSIFGLGSWVLLEPLLSPPFVHLDGATGEGWTSQERYIEDLHTDPIPAIEIDQIAVYIDGDIVTAAFRREARAPAAQPRRIEPRSFRR